MKPLEQVAGGIVVGPDGRIVVTCQQGRSWSLPKGHLEAGEGSRDAAEREITEECGLTDLRHVRTLGSYIRSSISGTGRIIPGRLKNIEMYLYTSAGGPLAPGDPDNPCAVWADLDTAARMLTHTADAAFLTSRVADVRATVPATEAVGAPDRPAHTAVVLAAGLGTRLAPYTELTPKTCVPVAGVPLIVRTLDAVTAAGINRTVIVVGHLADQVVETVKSSRPELDVRFVFNEDYAGTGTAVSLRRGLEALDPVDVPVIVEGDVVLEPAVLERLLARPNTTTAVETYRPELSGSFMSLNDEARVLAITRADWRSPQADITRWYKTVNVHVVSHTDLLATWMPTLVELTDQEPRAHLEHLLHRCLEIGVSLEAVDVAGLRWCEVDDAADLAIAERLFAAQAAALSDDQG